MKKILAVLSVLLMAGFLFSCKGLLGEETTGTEEAPAEKKNPLVGTQWKDEIAASYNLKDGNVLEFVYDNDTVVNGTWSYTEPDFQYTIGSSSKKGVLEFTTDNKKMVLIENAGSPNQTAMVFSKVDKENLPPAPDATPADPHDFVGEIWKDDQGNTFEFDVNPEGSANVLKYNLKYTNGVDGTWELAENELTMTFGTPSPTVKGIVEFTKNAMLLTHTEGADAGKIEVYINIKKAPAAETPDGSTSDPNSSTSSSGGSPAGQDSARP